MMRIIMLKAPQQIASHAPETFLEELVFHPFVGRDERQAPLKTPAWEATRQMNPSSITVLVYGGLKCRT